MKQLLQTLAADLGARRLFSQLRAAPRDLRSSRAGDSGLLAVLLNPTVMAKSGQLQTLGLWVASLLAWLTPLRSQDLWNEVNHGLTTANLWSIAYGDRTLVAVGEQGTLLTFSYDDQVWRPRSIGERRWLVGAAYGNRQFMIVGEGGLILTSDDSGGTWTPRVSGTTLRLNAAAYGNGRWLVVGEQGVVLTSTDGVSWESRPALGSGFLRALAFGQGRWLLGGASGVLYTTTDATTFLRVPFGTGADLEGAAISSSRFWLVGSAGLRASAAALDSWAVAANPPPATFRGVTVRNDEEASAVGERVGDTFASRPTAPNSWVGNLVRIQFLATAVVQGINEVVCVGHGGRIARSSISSTAYIVTDTGRNVVYGSDVGFRVLSGSTPISYQWLRNGAPIPGETNAEFVIRQVTPASGSGSLGLRLTTAQGTSSLALGYLLNVVPAGRPELRAASFSSALPDIPSLAVTQPDGKVLVAGPFSVATANGPTYGLARLNRDGSIDSGFRAGEGIPQIASVSEIRLLSDGGMYVRGSFSTIAGQPRPGLARLGADGALDLGFNPATTPDVAAIAPTSDGRLVAQVGGSATRPGVLVRLGRDGSRDGSFPAIPDRRLLGIDAHGRILALRAVALGGSAVLTRHLPEGAPDATYTETALVFGSSDPFSRVHLVGDTLFATSANNGSALSGTFNTYSRFLPDGGRDPAYNPPASPTSQSGYTSSAYFPDGTLLRVSGPQAVARMYAPNGAVDPTRYATLPTLNEYTVLSAAADGTVYGVLRSANVAAQLVRLDLLFGRRGRLSNLSVRAFVSSADAPLIAGFVTSGNQPTRALVRAIGPSLERFGVTDALADPQLALTRDAARIEANDDWDGALAPRFAAIGAFPLDLGTRDAALESPIAIGNYTAIASPASGSGTALVELYESIEPVPETRRFINISARGLVAPGRPLIVGFNVGGDVPVNVLIRAAGPALAGFGVSDPLSNPRLTLYQGKDPLWENDNVDSQVNAVAVTLGAFPFPNASRDSGMIVTLAPGSYTAVAENADATPGTALIEVYETP